jgi:hypothetical protein
LTAKHAIKFLEEATGVVRGFPATIV